jgi:hypothetical protein
LARSRNFLFLAQAVIGLLFLAWLPAMGDAGSENPFLFQTEEVFSLSDPSNIGEPDRDGWGDGENGPDAPALAIGSRSNPDVNGRRIRQGLPAAVLLANLFGARHATGPPGRRS